MTYNQTRFPTASGDPLGTASRRAALRVLDAVLRRGESLEAALPGATRAVHGPDRGLAHAIAAEALRWLPDLDALIDAQTRQRLPDDAKARFALRVALVQVLRLNTPPHAAIATVLPLVDGGPRKLVHGVFGSVVRAGEKLPDIPTLPGDTAARWSTAWGEEAAQAAARALAAPPPLDLSLRDDEWSERLDGRTLAPRHVRLDDATAVPELPGYAEGGWWVQDLAASLPARLLGTGSGTVLDLCAAPGGKTCQLAAAGWQVTALDQSQSRLARLRDNLTRTRLIAEVVRADALEWSPPAPYDAVLLDSPCSASGIFRRHPDVLHRFRPELLDELVSIQARLLARAAAWVRPGGTLVYATCSLEPAEGEHQAERFLADHPTYTLVAPAPGELPVEATGRGWVRTVPGTLEAQGGCDGFFAARFRRAG
ncbi:MAG: SAM-dependent methyltransferase [Sphingomonas bacterium]|uniref:RsmB/NOP family class I SAM-dependent RNA methyltransferase n=1 Tax=Sphingomonas bacterium TaxID=1895847 RepID=UPI00260B44C9|nr:transcription antitermination factor NusB [Sphingomonas bacterium]MDB5697159.1 SAM-dependent methyltransferase [Sphingomonas bacterium]